MSASNSAAASMYGSQDTVADGDRDGGRDSDEDEDDICDVDDLEDDDDDDYSTTSSLDSFGPTDLEDDVAMQLDPTVEGPMVSGCPPPAPLEKLPAPPRPIPFTAGHLPPSSALQSAPSMLTSSFRARDLLRMRAEGDGTPVNVFVEPKIPDGISLRNFGIQVVSVAFPFSLWRWRTVGAYADVEGETMREAR